MRAIDRRRFLQVAGGTAAVSLFSTSIARAAQIAPSRRTGTLADVEHVVVLMQENRSFDHYFGTLRGVRGFGDPHPVVQANGAPIWNQSGVLPFHPTANDLGLQFIEDLAHDWDTTHQALNGGAYDQWVPAKSNVTMAYLDRGDIPFHYALADAFTICDQYHCSLLGPTDPNRYYMWTGYVGNDGKGGGPVLDNSELGYDWQTYPERLEAAGVSWKIYQDIGTGLDAAGSWGWTDDAYIGNYGDNSLLYFDNYRNAAPGSALYEKARTGTNAAAGQGFFDILKADVRGGRLPQVSWVVAPEAFCEHPNWPANYGAWYVAQVLDALTSDPAVWSRTALIITFDENDGFFDHAVPPYPPASAAQGASTVDVGPDLYAGGNGFTAGPYGLGPRVPMLVVSPWSRGGFVCSEVLDHTSIIRFLEKRFGVVEPDISPWRRAVCGDLTSAFDFRQASTGLPALPSTSGYRPPDSDRHDSYVPTPPADQAMPKQEPGVRYARPLPYDLAADAAVRDGELTIEFASDGAVGAVFHVTSRTASGGPWTYTAGAGKRLSGTWPVTSYDFSVHGPNGFFRQFAGAGGDGDGDGDGTATTGTTGAAAPEVVAQHVEGNLRLAVRNPTSRTARLTVADAYAGTKASLTVPAGDTTVRTVSTASGHGWYDISITAESDATYLRRLAGHVETGRPGVSDPALGRA